MTFPINKLMVITLKGKTEYDIDAALDEAASLFKKGYLEGANSNDTGSFRFDVQDIVSTDEQS